MEFKKPGPNKRLCAYLIDMFLASLIVTVLSYALAMIIPQIIAVILSSILVSVGLQSFLLLFRDSFNGQSPGKMVVGLRIESTDDQPVTVVKSILRNILMIIPFFWLVEYAVSQRNPQGLRIGDKLAKTRVTDLKPQLNDNWFLLLGIAVLIFWYVAGNFAAHLIAAVLVQSGGI